MIDTKSDLVRRTLESGTGAEVSLRSDRSSLQTSLKIWFTDLTSRCGPVISLGPSGLRRHKVVMAFGEASTAVVHQINQADDEAQQLACALTASIDQNIQIEFPPGMSRNNWFVDGSDFIVSAEKRDIQTYLEDDEIILTCEEIVVPFLAAMAELIGYDEILPEQAGDDDPGYEGGIKQSVIRRRERNPRNRLLALRLNGYRCRVCQSDPREAYGAAGQIIEVHHLEPLATLDAPRVYDPATDLIPLCPTCHRAVHTRRPIPWAPHEIEEMMAHVSD